MTTATVSILNVGQGDTKLSFDKKNPKERERASKIVADMLRRGYALLVQVGKRQGEPIYQRVKAFDPKRCEYIVAGGPDEHIDIGAGATAGKPAAKKKRGRGRPRKLPANTTRAVAVSRTAGGCPPTDTLEPAERDRRLRAVGRMDRFAPLRNRVSQIATERGEWAGVPMPLDGEHLIIEPSYPFAAALSSKNEPEDTGDTVRVRQVFWSRRHRRHVIVWEENGKVGKVWARGCWNLDHQLRTMGCADAWGLAQEATALETLATLLPAHQFKKYLLTGTFLESSRRSGLTYMFRKLRPTVVLDARGDSVRARCTLCMHPIGYYDNSFAGAMCPTDDVISHLMLMRGDEPMLWRRCNQHSIDRPEAAL